MTQQSFAASLVEKLAPEALMRLSPRDLVAAQIVECLDQANRRDKRADEHEAEARVCRELAAALRARAAELQSLTLEVPA